MKSEEFDILCNDLDSYKEVEQKGEYIEFEEIEQMSNLEFFDKIKIYGLKQDTFEYFIETQAHKFDAIMFWQNKSVHDWSKLSELKNVRFIGWYNNNKIDEIWDMTENKELEGLCIQDFSKMKSLDGIEKAPRLERLNYGNRLDVSVVLNDLDILEKTKIKEFYFSGKSVLKEDLLIYTKMKGLEKLDFRTNMYTTEQLAWLVANLPKVKGFSLRPFVEFEKNEDEKDILICGKRKPFLSSKKDKEKIERYVDEFEGMVEQYKKENKKEPK